MSFSPDWLALREPADLAARDPDLRTRAAAAAGEDAIVMDLGSGTGSTARAFVDPVCVNWRWRFVDGDPVLLKVAQDMHEGADCVVMNLRDIDDLPLQNVSLVTASALLDLMPETWMMALAARLKAAQVPFYAALNYDGVMYWSPQFDGDAVVTAAFNRHQETDKGIGAAMGPTSGQRAAQILEAAGFDVELRQSPWRINAPHDVLHQQLIAGIGDAAAEMGAPDAAQWAQDRIDALAQTVTTIGHTDLLARPR